MNAFIKTGVCGFLLLFSALICAQGNYQEGTHYHRIDPKVAPVGDGDTAHEVIELFWYACPHCYDFEPFLDSWLENAGDNVTFIRIPAILNPRWEQHARAYYALEMMGELDNGHSLLFEGIHEQNRSLFDLDAMARFLAANKIDEAKFRENFNSFAVETKINRAKELMRQYKITGVPTIIVDGEFKISASSAGGYIEVVEVVEKLTSNESK